MLLISCPYCGPRALAEFAFERPAESIVPLLAGPEEAMGRLYTRTNAKGPSRELWRHAFGCGSWLALVRDTGTHEIFSVSPVGGPA